MPDHVMNYVESEAPAELTLIEWRRVRTAAGVVALHPPDLRAGRGFGLPLLDLVATRWGVRRGQSTTVWFDMGRE